MAVPDLDLALLRTFVSVADSGGFSSAGARVHRTQSTISLQIRKLEEEVGRKLLHRSAHKVAPTEDGERLLAYARRILALTDVAASLFLEPVEEVVRLGVPEDYAADRLPPILASFAANHPTVRLEVQCDMSSRLSAGLDSGDLDVVLLKEVDGDRPAIASWTDPLTWMAGPLPTNGGVAPELHPILPLVAYPQGCVFRKRAVHELERRGRPWRVAYSSASLMGIQAAVRAGLGVAVGTERGVPADFRRLGVADGLPALPDSRTALFARMGLGAGGRAVLELLATPPDAVAVAA